MSGLYVLPVRVVEEIKRFSHDGVGEDKAPAVLQLPLDGRVADRAHAVRAGQKNRSLEKPGLLDPVDACHIAVSVLIERRGKHWIPIATRSGQKSRDARANRSLSWYERAFALDQGDVTDRDASNVG